MTAEPDPGVGPVLRYLADLADREDPVTRGVVVRRKGDLVPLGWFSLFAASRPDVPPRSVQRTPSLERLRSLDRLHRDERLLRVGWLWLAGTARVDGKARRFLVPLVSAPGVVTDIPLRRSVTVGLEDDPAVDPAVVADRTARDRIDDELSDVIANLEWQDMNDALLRRFERFRGRIRAWLAAGGIDPVAWESISANPWDHRQDDPAVLVPTVAVYLARDVDAPSVAGDLRTWAGRGAGGTALAHLYGADEIAPTAGAGDGDVESAYSLNERQRVVLLRAKTAPLTVVSGPPGTGKSHTVAALAVDEVARGGSVLVATHSAYAADVVADLLERHPGPRFVRFGSRDRRRRVADDLASGMADPYDPREREEMEDRRRAAVERVAGARARVIRLLEREEAFTSGLATRTALAAVAADVPAAADPDLDGERVVDLWDRVTTARRWFAGWRRRRALARLRRLLGARPALGDAVLADAVRYVAAERDVARGVAGGGVTLTGAWEELEAAADSWREANGRLIEAIRRDRQNRSRVSARAVGALATALRSGRAVRRKILRDLRSENFLDVLPLWVGTLGEIDDTLPVEPAVFDLVVLDEASQIDQTRAASALARGRRAVIVGDPRQLRHVSFVGDDDMADAAAVHGLGGGLGRILDVRRNSVFDAAAAAAPVTVLDEHFRSVPHIIQFSDREFYDGRLRLMTVHPATEVTDAIRTVRVGGSRDQSGVNRQEIGAVLAEVRRLIDAGAGSVGIVTPFRAQADALESRLLDAFTPEEIDATRLRVGTVHAFQGNERDVVIVSIGLGPEDAAASLRFVEDPNLFNVMVTRARREIVLVVSLDPAGLGDGLLRRYLRHAERAPTPAAGAPAPPGWVGDLASRLTVHGLRVTPGYAVAGHRVDLAVGEGPEALGVECVVHPDGPAAHIVRRAALRRAGWDLADAFRSRWLADPDGAVERLVEQMLRRAAGRMGVPPASRG